MKIRNITENISSQQRAVGQLPADFDPPQTSPQLNGPYAGRNATRGYLVGEDQDMAEGIVNELDIMAPRTTYFRMGDGRYVKADYRASGGYDSVPSFVEFQWVDPKIAQQLNLDRILSSPSQSSTLANEPGRRQIASPAAYQAGGPLSQRNIDVIDTHNPPKHHSSGLKSKLATWVAQQDKKQGVAEATGDEKFDTMMRQIQREPKYPDSQMPPTDVKDLYQWAVKNNKPYHKIFAEWANREGYKSVAPALQRAGDLDTEALDYWTPRVWEIYWGEVRGIDSEMPPEWAKKRIPDELRDYLDTVFDAYDRIVFDWPTEYRQIGQQGMAEGIDPYRLERLDPKTRRVLIRMGDHKDPGSWLSASEAYAMMLGLQYKNRDPRGWEQEVQHYVDLYRQYSGQGVAESGWNPLDDERREQRAMDAERRQFKRDEIEAELGGEEERYRQIMQGTWYIVIDGQVWRRQGEPVTFSGREAARRAGQTIKNRTPERTVTITTKLSTQPIAELTDMGTAVAAQPTVTPTANNDQQVEVIFFGVPGKDYWARDAWDALEEVLPNEYPRGSERAQLKIAEVQKHGGAVVTVKPLAQAKKLVDTSRGYGIKARINASGINESVIEQERLRIFRESVAAGMTSEDVITTMKRQLGDYLQDVATAIRKDPDLIKKIPQAVDQIGPAVRTIKTDDGHEIRIHGNEDDGFRISIRNRTIPKRFKSLDEAEIATEMYCARRRQATQLRDDYVDEA
jgi:hypothetical protein